MNKILSAASLAAIILLPSCIPPCVPVTGPDDISYSALAAPSCASDPYNSVTGDFLINSDLDYDAYCSGGAAPAGWDFVNKTYIVIQYYTGLPEPYLAGVGNDPSDVNRIVATIGNPCSDGPVPAIALFKVFCLEIPKTAKTLKVDKLSEFRP